MYIMNNVLQNIIESNIFRNQVRFQHSEIKKDTAHSKQASLDM